MKQSLINLVKLLITKRFITKLLIIVMTCLAVFNIYFVLDYFWYKGLQTAHYLFMLAGAGIAAISWTCWPKKQSQTPAYYKEDIF